MDSLRWILLLIGTVIVAGIWWVGHRRSRERDESLFERARRDRRDGEEAAGLEGDRIPDFDVAAFETRPGESVAEPSAGPADTSERIEAAPTHDAESPGVEEADTSRSESKRAGRARSSRHDTDTAPTREEERLEVVYVLAARGERFVGSRLQELFVEHGLQHGEMEIFHGHDAEGRTLFSVANLVEPGTFDPATMDTLSTPGLALFVRLPGPTSAEIAFDRMIATARALADALEGRVLDQQHSTLTRQTEQHLRDQMRAFDHHRQSARR